MQVTDETKEKAMESDVGIVWEEPPPAFEAHDDREGPNVVLAAERAEVRAEVRRHIDDAPDLPDIATHRGRCWCPECRSLRGEVAW